MAVASWMIRSRSARTAKTLRNRTENKDDAVKLNFNLHPSILMQEILSSICQKHGVSSVKKLNYLNAFVQLINKNPDWRSSNIFGFSKDEIFYCLRIALIQDSVQVRAVGLRALRYVVKTEEDILYLNKLHFPYLISRSLDLLLKSDNERVLMSERIQSLKMMRHILSIAPQHFSIILGRPLISVVLRPVEETDRLLKACLAVLCELCVLNSAVFIECDGVRALLRNAILIPSSHMVEAICGSLLFLLNKPSTRNSAKIDLRYLISGYTNSAVVEKNSFREEERRLLWTNFVLLTLLKSCGGIFELCDYSGNISGLKSIVQTLYLDKHNVKKAILELLYELMNIPQPEWTDDENVALESIQFSRFQESFKLTEGFVVSEGKYILPNLVNNRVNLTEVHTSLLLICLLEANLPDALVEVIVSSDSYISLQASILLGEFLHLIRRYLPLECYAVPPSLPNLVSYAVRGCPLQSFVNSISNDMSEPKSDLNEQYFFNCSYYSKNFHYTNEGNDTLFYTNNSKTVDLRFSNSNLNVPDNSTTKFSSSENVLTKDITKSSMNIVPQQDFTEESVAYFNSENDDFIENRTFHSKCKSSLIQDTPFKETIKDVACILNKNRVDLPPCKQKQRMALSAVSVLSNLRRILEKPRTPVSLLLNNVAQYGEKNQSSTMIETFLRRSKKKMHKVPVKEFEELIKETGVLIISDASRWKWDSIRILLKFSVNNSKMLNDANFKVIVKKLINFFKPSSKKYSHTPIKYDSNTINIYTLVACDLVDILLDPKNNDGLKTLMEFLEDIEVQLKQIIEAKSVHDCLLSPQRLTNSLSQDYFVLIGRLSNSEAGMLILQKSDIIIKLHHIAVNINLDYYVKLIVSCLSYITSEVTRKLFSSVLSCTYVSSRLYATKFLHVLLRTGAFKNESFCNWIIEMLVNQLYDENETISMIALNALNEAVDKKEYLDVLISLRPSLLHLGDTGLLLLIRFLSTEKGFSYLQAANFVIPQLHRWASSFNIKYIQIVEGELHDAMSQYQRGDDGRYRKRITGNKAVLKDVIVPPHLYGQLVQHMQGFNLLLKQESIHKMIQVILIGDYETDEAVLELKSALWAMGHFSTSSLGAKYLSDCGVIKSIVALAEKATIYSVKTTAFYVMSIIATSVEGVAALHKTRWRCLKRNRQDSFFTLDNPFSSFSLSDDDDSETMSSPLDFDSLQNDNKNLFEPKEDELGYKCSNKFFCTMKSATLPQRGSFSSQMHHRSLSESKADASDDSSSSESPLCNVQNYTSNIKVNSESIKLRSDSCGTDSSTSGVSSSDSVYGKLPNLSEKVPTLTPIPSTSSLSISKNSNHQKEHRKFLMRRHSSLNFNCRLNAQSALRHKTFRFLQNRHHPSNCATFSASATMEYLSINDRRQISPLMRSNFPRYIQKPLTPEFEIKDTPFRIDKNDSLNTLSPMENSRFSHSTEIDENKIEVSEPCYQGICLPLKLYYFLPQNSDKFRNSVLRKLSLMKMTKDELDFSGDSGSEQKKNANNDRTVINSYKRRRHDMSACLLCSLKTNVFDTQNVGRSRKTSTSSVHRTRTETESSYGGSIAQETESPILLTWQQKPVGLVDTTFRGASSSTIETNEMQSTSIIANNESSLKSRSLLRKEVLKLIEQLGNPVLYKTCKQGLLQLKQICGDLFQDICLFSDICSLLGSINYRIHARQLIQDLFLDAPFHELYEEISGILNKALPVQENDDSKLTTLNNSFVESFSSQIESKPPIAMKSPSIFKDVSNSENVTEERKNNTNGNLEVIVEADIIFETAKNEIVEISEYEGELCSRSSHLIECCNNTSQYTPLIDKSQSEGCTKNLYDYRRAYSYPVTNQITDFRIQDPNKQYMYSYKVPTTRSRSVSAICSYISEISVTQHQTMFNTIDDMSHNPSSISDSLLLDNKINNLKFTERSLISLKDRSSSVLLAFENPYNVLDLRSQILIKDGSVQNVYEYDKNKPDVGDGKNEKVLTKNLTDAVKRHRKRATFESPDQNLLLKHNQNI